MKIRIAIAKLIEVLWVKNNLAFKYPQKKTNRKTAETTLNEYTIYSKYYFLSYHIHDLITQPPTSHCAKG